MSDELEARLSRLRQLLERGHITEADYLKQKDALLSAAMGTGPSEIGREVLRGATHVGSPSEASSSPLAGPTSVDQSGGFPAQIGSYRILGLIGAGGMGTVLRARHVEEGWARRQGGDVALKLIHSQYADDKVFRERFLDEAELGKRIRHPGLAVVHELVVSGAWLGTVMELVEGWSLEQYVTPGGLPIDQVLALLTPIAEAVDHLHSVGIIHRDLKPANIKVRRQGVPVILDLGIAKDLTANHEHTRTATAMGTVAWMAPEQVDAKRATPAADRYSFGLIAYALLSGRLPWEADASAGRITALKLSGHLAQLEFGGEGADAVGNVVMAMLSLDPGRRFGSCRQFVFALAEAYEHQQSLLREQDRQRASQERMRAEREAGVPASGPYDLEPEGRPTSPAELGLAPERPSSPSARVGHRWRWSLSVVVGVVALMLVALVVVSVQRHATSKRFALLRGEALAVALAGRNLEAIGDQNNLALDANYLLGLPGVKVCAITNADGVVRAPPEKVRQSIGGKDYFRDAQALGGTLARYKGGGLWHILTPFERDIEGTTLGQTPVGGWAYLLYDVDDVMQEFGRWDVSEHAGEAAAAAAMALASRNVTAIDPQNNLRLDGDFITDLPGVGVGMVTDTQGVVRAPPEKVRQSIGGKDYFEEASTRGRAYAVRKGWSRWHALAPIRVAYVEGAPASIHGWAYVLYDEDAALED